MSMQLKNSTYKIQNQFAEYCRTGVLKKEISGTLPERLPHYRRLVFNVVRSTLEQAFPITRKIMDDAEWENLGYRFFKEHEIQTPQVWKMPREFCLYVKENNIGEDSDRPYLNDLLWFEWLEIEVHTMPDEDVEAYLREGNILRDILVFNPEFRIMQLEYPVHSYAVKDAERLKGNYYVLIFRERETGNVKFISLSYLYVFVIEQLIENEVSLDELLPVVARVFNIENLDELKENVVAFIEDLVYRKMVLGFKPRNLVNE